MGDALSDLLLEARSLLWDGSTIARNACAARITDFLAADRQARQAPEGTIRVMKMCPKHEGQTFTFSTTALSAIPYCPICEQEKP